MRKGAVVQRQAAADLNAVQLVVDLKTGRQEQDKVTHPGIRYATHVVKVCGPQIGYAFIGIPCNTFGAEQVPAVALQRSGPAGKHRLRTRARIKYIENGRTVDLMSGYIVKYDHSIDEDSVVATVFDDRWLMEKITCFGRLTYNPENANMIYISSDELIFNRDGHPDCMDTSIGIPMFAPSRRYGYGATDSVGETSAEPAPGQATTKARSWRCCDIVQYLRYLHVEKTYQSGYQSYGNQKLSSYVQWSSSVANISGFDRVPKNFKCENLTLLEALSQVARKAGPYDINILPSGWYGRLEFVRVDTRRGGYKLTLPQYDNSTINELMNDSTKIMGGYISESIINYFDDVCICGDAPAIERTFRTGISGSTGEELGCLALTPAWSAAEETAFKLLSAELGGDQTAFEICCNKYPLVYAAYRIKNDRQEQIWDLGTKFAGTDTPLYNVMILKKLLSAYSQGSTNPRDWESRPYTIEKQETVSEWSVCDANDGLTFAQDGQFIMLDGLRRGSHETFIAAEWDMSVATARPIRITLAAQNYFRITGKASNDPNSTSYRVEHNKEQFTYLTVAEEQDYVSWQRLKSYPNGCEYSAYATDFPDKIGANSELFSDEYTRLPNHAQKRLIDVKRIEYAGQLVLARFNPSLQPGDQVYLDGGGITPIGIIRSITFDVNSQTQIIELVAADNKVIYDSPTQAAYATPSPGRSQKPEASKNPEGSSYSSDDYEDSSSGGIHNRNSPPSVAPPPPSSQGEDGKRADSFVSGTDTSPASNEFATWQNSPEGQRAIERTRKQQEIKDAENTNNEIIKLLDSKPAEYRKKTMAQPPEDETE